MKEKKNNLADMTITESSEGACNKVVFKHIHMLLYAENMHHYSIRAVPYSYALGMNEGDASEGRF